jgi:hypothetical protein
MFMAWSRLSAMLRSGESWLHAMQHITYSQISPQIQNRIWKYFRVLLRGLGTIDLWKNQRSKPCETVSLMTSEKSERILFWLRAIPKNSALSKSTESLLHAMLHSAEFWLRAMSHSVYFTKNFICDSALCHLVINSSQKFSCWLRTMRTAGSRFRSMLHIWLRLHAMPYSTELRLRTICAV